MARGRLKVTPVTTKDDLEEFIELPFRLYDGDANWVPPIKSTLRKQLDSSKNPFFEHAEATYFLARRGDDVVGRISSHTNTQYNDFQSRSGKTDRTGFFGFFECEDDPTAAGALFDAAAKHLSKLGMTSVVGPASFSMQDEFGLLVDGFDSPPMILMPYNPPHYADLIEEAGFQKLRNLHAYRHRITGRIPAAIHKGRRIKSSVRIRQLNMKEYESEIRLLGRMYEETFSEHWGFVPMTDAELEHMASEMKPVIDPRLIRFAEDEGRTVGLSVGLPNAYEVQRESGGSLGPVTLARFMWHGLRKSWESLRIPIVGVLEEYRNTDVGTQLVVSTYNAARKAGYKWAEAGWIEERNVASSSLAGSSAGGERYKTYRVYERAI